MQHACQRYRKFIVSQRVTDERMLTRCRMRHRWYGKAKREQQCNSINRTFSKVTVYRIVRIIFSFLRYFSRSTSPRVHERIAHDVYRVSSITPCGKSRIQFKGTGNIHISFIGRTIITFRGEARASEKGSNSTEGVYTPSIKHPKHPPAVEGNISQQGRDARSVHAADSFSPT